MKQPKRANPPICWVCDRMLAGGGWHYKMVTDPLGNEHPAHVGCNPVPSLTAIPRPRSADL